MRQLTLFSDQIKLSSKAKKEIITLVKAVETAKQSSLPLHEMFENLMNDVGYIDMLKKDLEDNRIDNIHELQRSIYEFQNQNPDIATIEIIYKKFHYIQIMIIWMMDNMSV